MKNFLALLVFAGGIAGWYLFQQKKQVTEGLEAAKYQIAEIEKVAVPKKAEFQAADSAMKIRAKIDERKVEQKNLQLKLQTVNEGIRTTQAEKLTTLSSIRQKFVGRTLPLTLTTGRDLGSVRIMKLEDASVTVATTSGVVKVLPNELPADLRAQFLYNY